MPRLQLLQQLPLRWTMRSNSTDGHPPFGPLQYHLLLIPVLLRRICTWVVRLLLHLHILLANPAVACPLAHELAPLSLILGGHRAVAAGRTRPEYLQPHPVALDLLVHWVPQVCLDPL